MNICYSIAQGAVKTNDVAALRSNLKTIIFYVTELTERGNEPLTIQSKTYCDKLARNIADQIHKLTSATTPVSASAAHGTKRTHGDSIPTGSQPANKARRRLNAKTMTGGGADDVLNEIRDAELVSKTKEIALLKQQQKAASQQQAKMRARLDAQTARADNEARVKKRWHDRMKKAIAEKQRLENENKKLVKAAAQADARAVAAEAKSATTAASAATAAAAAAAVNPPAPQVSSSTRTVWQVDLGSGNWVPFADNQQATLEKHYQDKTPPPDCNVKHGAANQAYDYEFDLSSTPMTQKNKSTSVKREIRRITEPILVVVAPTSRGSGAFQEARWSKPARALDRSAGIMVRRIKNSDVADGKHCREVLAFNHAEAQFTRLHKFSSNSGSAAAPTVTAVDVIENPSLDRMFQQKKSELRNAGKSDEEVWVFHGTPTKKVAQLIARGGFKIGGKNGHASINGLMYGQGVYSAVHSEDPIHYAKAKCVVLCRALPGKKGANRAEYDEVGTDAWNPKDSWWVFKHEAQILPQYVVYYK